ncbi:MAG TPA: hypothetical protein VIY27_11240 [Myxococcota bacterium]
MRLRLNVRWFAFGLTFGMVLAEYVFVPMVAAQDEPAAEEASTGEIVALRLRQPAPFAGLLIEQEDLVRWRLEIDSLRFRLDAITERAARELVVHQELAAAQLDAERARRELVQRLWTERATELRSALDEALERAQREVWEHPVIWLCVGLAVGAGGVAIAAAAVGAGG